LNESSLVKKKRCVYIDVNKNVMIFFRNILKDIMSVNSNPT